ncbi:MAG: hypothetical protein AYK19_06955 [Theionarchaea archaeon DG-70-1]|nr:MAG: hypothetical protein AYK19_06955 [Theionarchaea archaeon DG-70-1]
MEFYSEPITVQFTVKPLLEKKPGLPAAFTWRGKSYKITKLLKEWHDYRKRGKMEEFYSKKRGNAPECSQIQERSLIFTMIENLSDKKRENGSC